jgi:hypothetical protein
MRKKTFMHKVPPLQQPSLILLNKVMDVLYMFILLSLTIYKAHVMA